MNTPPASAADRLVLVLGGVSFNSIVYLKDLPKPRPQTIHDAGFREGTGSTGAGKALTLAKLGVRHHLLAAVGQDRYGEHVLADLAAQGVNVEPIWDRAGTERHVNLLDQHGGRLSMFVNRSSAEVECDDARFRSLLDRADIVMLNIGAYCRPWIAAVKASGKPVWVDLHDYDGVNPYHDAFIDAATHLQFGDEAVADPQALQSRFIAEGKLLAICTSGPRGASVVTADGLRFERAALPGIQAVDSDGAGDAFMVGYLFAWLRGETPSACLDKATICGGYTVTEKGLVFSGLSRDWLSERVDELSAIH